jgi:hypothetical protein
MKYDTIDLYCCLCCYILYNITVLCLYDCYFNIILLFVVLRKCIPQDGGWDTGFGRSSQTAGPLFRTPPAGKAGWKYDSTKLIFKNLQRWENLTKMTATLSKWSDPGMIKSRDSQRGLE